MVKLFGASFPPKNLLLPFCIRNYKGEITYTSAGWTGEIEKSSTKILSTPNYEFIEINGTTFQKLEFTEGGETQVYLIPSNDYAQTLQINQELEHKIRELDEKIRTFIEKSPYPLCILQKNSNKVVFANKLLLDTFQIPLSKFYNGIYLSNLIQDASIYESVLSQITQNSEVKGHIFQVKVGETVKWLMMNSYTFALNSLQGNIVSFVDITSEKEREMYLMELKVEIESQNEELKQNNIVLQELYNKLELSYQDTQQGLISGQITQKIISRSFRLSNYLPKHRYFQILKPHSYVSGDFYWSKQKDNYLYIAVGDATGHGVSGGLLAITFTTLLSQYFYYIERPSQIHELLNLIHNSYIQDMVNEKTEINVEGGDISIVAIPLDEPNHFYYTAAHAKLLIYSHANTSVLQGQKHPVGFYVKGVQNQPYETYKINCTPQDKLFLFTDGIKDMMNINSKKYSLKNLKLFIEKNGHLPMREIKQLLTQEIESYQWGEQNDDIQVVGIALS
ncbi:MAG: serine/threonine-protein phosphatase [Bacteroidia bacterium]|nr:serine/threonine-protein phosphatase [Bacteroidia bacterium]MDW8348228.1 PP2C family protein-serine/threonine phosphatase [Bacteroidia bacterium]